MNELSAKEEIEQTGMIGNKYLDQEIDAEQDDFTTQDLQFQGNGLRSPPDIFSEQKPDGNLKQPFSNQ